jgi:hypothetical protein
MIEVRIPARDFAEYATPEGANGYIYGKLIAANIPMQTDGRLMRGEMFNYTEFCGDCLVYQWCDGLDA